VRGRLDHRPRPRKRRRRHHHRRPRHARVGRASPRQLHRRQPRAVARPAPRQGELTPHTCHDARTRIFEGGRINEESSLWQMVRSSHCEIVPCGSDAAEAMPWRMVRREAYAAIAAIQSRLTGAAPGQLSLPEGDGGELSLADGSTAGQVSSTDASRAALPPLDRDSEMDGRSDERKARPKQSVVKDSQ
jgi:hypothetical protein